MEWTRRLPADERPPGPPGLPVIGNAHEFARDRLGFLSRCHREYGDVVYVEVAGRPFYQLHDPDAIRRVLVDDNENYVKGELFQRQLGFLGNGLLTAEGESWRRQRHAIEPAFHPDRIAGYAEMMTGFTERALDGWQDGEVRNVHRDMMELTLDIVAAALFDVDIREEAGEVGDALSAVMAHFRRSTARPVDVPDWVPTPTNLRYRRALDTLDEVVADIVRERRREARPDGASRIGEGRARERAPDAGDVVSQLLAATDDRGRRMSDEQVRDEVLTLLLAGHETTAQALTFALHLLARHPAVADRLRDELADVLGGETPTTADLPELTYTERVVRESMRLYPPAYSTIREATGPDTLGGYRVPAGAQVGLYQWTVHRDPEHYADPKAFVPERWTDEFRRDLHPFAYFPFGGGPRRCVGDRFAMLEARLVLATLCQRYRLELVSEPELELSPSITLRPAGSVDFGLHER